MKTHNHRPSYAEAGSALRAGAWVAGGQAVGVVATLAGTRFITQLVDPATFGNANLLQNAIALLRGCGSSALLNGAYRFFADAARDRQVPALRALLRADLARLTAVLAVILVLGLTLFHAASPFVAGLLVILLCADTARNFELTLLAAAHRQRLVALLTVFENIARPAAIVLLAWIYTGSTAAVLGGVCLSLILTVLVIHLGQAQEGRSPPAAAAGTQYAPGLRRYALSLAPYGLLTWLVSVSDRYIIEWVTRDAAAVGIYAAGYALVSQPFIMLNGVLAATLRPVWFSAVSAGDKTADQRTFRLWLVLAAAAAGLGVFLSWLLSAWAVRLLLAPRYAPAAALLPWIAAGYFFFCIQQVMENRLLAHKQSATVLVTGVVAAFLAVTVTVLLVQKFGMRGAAYACPIYFCGHCLVSAWFAGRESS